MIEYMDMLAGKIVKKTKELGISDNTIIIFTGDNGTDREMTSVYKGKKLKGEKGLLTDAGARVPFLVKWPGVVQPGTVSDALIDLSDMVPTFAEIASVELPQNQPVDGDSFVPVLKSEPFDWERSLFFSFPALSRWLRESTALLRRRRKLLACSTFVSDHVGPLEADLFL